MESSCAFKYLIMNSNEPLILRNSLQWPMLKWDLKKWEELLQGENLKFRCGRQSFTKEPQWERTTDILTMSFSDFLIHAKSKNDDRWMYFDYKYLDHWFKNIQEIRKHVDWSAFGFPNLSSDESTIWIGSKGAHTPCHIDTYGCNLIAQIYGKKQWLIFPPEEDLKPTRIPYEESSIYSKINFYSPTSSQINGINLSKCHRIILEAGDVLFLPHKWWHYVENMETAISINVWLPLDEVDDKERLSESVVNLLMCQICKDLTTSLQKIVLNPNSDKDILSPDFNLTLELMKTSKEKCLENGKRKKRTSADDDDRTQKAEIAQDVTSNLSEVFTKYPDFIRRVPKLSVEEFKAFLKEQGDRFLKMKSDDNSTDELGKIEDVVQILEAITHPEVIHLMRQKLLT